MTRKVERKLVAILKIIKDAVEHHQDKTEDERLVQYLGGQRDALEGMLRLIQTGNAAELMLWCNSRQKIMIDDILCDKVKI